MNKHVQIGSRCATSNESRHEHDYYATHPSVVLSLLEHEKFHQKILEPCAGQGHIVKTLEEAGYYPFGIELYNYTPIDKDLPIIYGLDFLKANHPAMECDIIANPPFKQIIEFIRKCYCVLQPGRKMAILARILFLESKERNELFEEMPFSRIYIPAKRYRCALNGEFEKYGNKNAVAFAWYIWEKGYKGDSIIKFIKR